MNDISREVVDAAIQVHRALGPGLLESAYQVCLAHELRLRGLAVDREVPIELAYKDLRVPEAYFADLVVGKCVVVELKAVEALNAVHDAQVITYLKLLGAPLGILLNFNTARIMEGGFKRIALNHAPPSPDGEVQGDP